MGCVIMYNRETKNLYLETLDTDARKRFNTIFNYLEQLETLHNEDIYDMPYEVILAYLMQHGSYSNYSSIYDRYTSIKQYKTWALLNNYIADDAKAYVDEKCNLKPIYIQYCKVPIFKYPAELEFYLKKRLYSRNLPDGSTANNVVTIDELTAALCMLVYNGFTADEALRLKVENVHIAKTDVAIITDNKIVQIYEEFKSAVLKVVKNRQYWKVSGRQSEIIDLSDDIFDNGVSDTITKLRNSYLRVMYHRDVDLKFTDLFYIGKLYDYFSHHDPRQRYKRLDIIDYCFPDQRPTHRKREQFYRILELWENK